jgi:hypothetical protein
MASPGLKTLRDVAAGCRAVFSGKMLSRSAAWAASRLQRQLKLLISITLLNLLDYFLKNVGFLLY